jgi:hypothetical protein
MNDLNKLKESIASFDKKIQEIRADLSKNPTPEQSKYNDMMDYMNQCMSSLRNYVYGAEEQIHNRINNHTNPQNSTHAPNLKTASHVSNYLDMCGMAEDYTVEKPKIQVKASRQGYKQFEVSINTKKS